MSQLAASMGATDKSPLSATSDSTTLARISSVNVLRNTLPGMDVVVSVLMANRISGNAEAAVLCCAHPLAGKAAATASIPVIAARFMDGTQRFPHAARCKPARSGDMGIAIKTSFGKGIAQRYNLR